MFGKAQSQKKKRNIRQANIAINNISSQILKSLVKSGHVLLHYI